MGCWNKTCGITQLPIMAGEPVVYFIIYQSGKADNFPCYSSSLGWSIIPIPIYGKYDDYGGCEDDPNQEYKYSFIKQALSSHLVDCRDDFEKSQTEYNDPFVNGESISHCVNRNVWKLGHNKSEMSIFMIHREVYEKLTEYVTSFSGKKIYVNDVIKYYNNVLEKTKGMIPLDTEYYKIVDDINKQDKLSYMISSIVENLIVGWQFNTITYGQFKHLFSMKKLLDADICTIDEIVKINFLNAVMAVLRKSLAPMPGEGSQDGYDGYHYILNNFVNKKLKQNEFYIRDLEDMKAPISEDHAIELFKNNSLFCKDFWKDDFDWQPASNFYKDVDDLKECFEKHKKDLGYFP
jgi:hypothetical protein